MPAFPRSSQTINFTPSRFRDAPRFFCMSHSLDLFPRSGRLNMPVTSPLATPDLKFDVAAPEGWSYSAGDTIIGNLIRHTPIVTPEATIVLTLIGRIKTKITKSTNSSRTHCRSECILVKSEQPVIACHPLHLPENSGTPSGTRTPWARVRWNSS